MVDPNDTVALQIAASEARNDSKFAQLIGRSDSRFAELMGRMDTTVAKIMARFDATDARFDATDARFDATDARIDAIETRLNARMDHIEMRLDQTETLNHSTRANIWSAAAFVVGSMIAIIALLATIAPYAFDRGETLHDAVAHEVQRQVSRP